MIPINLPSYAIKLGGSPEKPLIFDDFRRRFVSLTPEEWVRQHFLHFLVERKGYPRSLIGSEVSLRLGEKQLRADGVLYRRDLSPRMVLEFKAPQVALTPKVLEQAEGYNRLLRVDYVVLSNGLEHRCYRLGLPDEPIRLLSEIPRYADLV